MNHTKYRPFTPLNKPNRRWPSSQITKAPIWCSVDLRDGNQAIETPMTIDQKLAFFTFLCDLGFKEIEVGFPAASDTEYEFTRRLIEENLIPDDVTIQVLTQSRAHIIERTFESLAGVKKAIVHLYNSTSTLQRDVVFGKTMAEVKEIAVSGAELLVALAEKYGKEKFRFEYSPESFTGTEMDYAIDVCNAVLAVLKPTPARKVIINLPSTVEMATPNVYADQIEYVADHLNDRENVLISLHAHNDRGTAVASTELALLAGADRVEGTLFGNGERTGNADVLNIAMNLYSQGIDPQLDFSNIDHVISVYQDATFLNVHERHPYAGALVFTAFSGSHQDAINKGMAKMKEHPEQWAVPYLPIDPSDIGRTYDAIIRINSQSGKGGVAYILETNFGLVIPKNMQPVLGTAVTRASDEKAKEMLPQELFELFKREFVNLESPVALVSYSEETNGESTVTAAVLFHGEERKITGTGNGLIDAFCNALSGLIGRSFEVENYSEHSLEYGSGSRAITYVQLASDGKNAYFGAGISRSISKSSLKAIVSAVNMMI
ncbi:MAG: 2-isopropylmalate synthase [Clostridiales bacterium]|jgi:2-isopropylmalate synthase|nr:2-isopropylmalate synthase [Clostridiales bacterium]